MLIKNISIMHNIYSIAIDGPSASGKSTIAQLLAQKLNISYINTGKMYRSIAYCIDMNKIYDEQYIKKFCTDEKTMSIKPIRKENEVIFTYNGETLRHSQICSQQTAENASKISTILAIRKLMKTVQQESSHKYSIVMEGRDICNNILPNAKYKFFVTASPRIRAIRRLKQNKRALKEHFINQVSNEITQRDKRDSERKHNPLKRASDTALIDTSELTINETLNEITSYINE